MESSKEEKLNKIRIAYNQVSGVIITNLPKGSEVTQIKFYTPSPTTGAHISYPCHKAASQSKKSPQKLAEKIAVDLRKLDVVEEVWVESGFLNIRLNTGVILGT